MTTRVERFLAHACLLIASVVSVLVVAEGAARLYVARFASDEACRLYASADQLRARFGAAGQLLSAHRFLGTYPTPNYRKGPNRHNALGYRGDEISPSKPESVYRIVCTGGSTTYTTHVTDYRHAYPFLLEEELRRRGYGRVEVVNSGAPGWSSWESLINFELRVLDLEPDLLIVYHGVNDVSPRLVWPHEAYRGDQSGSRVARPALEEDRGVLEHSGLARILLTRLGLRRPLAGLAFLSRPAETYYGDDFDQQMWKGTYPTGLLRRVSPERMLATNRAVYFRRNLESLISVARMHGVEVVLSTFAHLPQVDTRPHSSWNTPAFWSAIEEHNEITKEVASAHGVALFDFAGRFPAEATYFALDRRRGEGRADAFHVNEEGARLKARVFAEFLVAEDVVPRSGAPADDAGVPELAARRTGRDGAP